MASCDIIVIGAGVIGTSVAFHLAELGAQRVLVLERGRFSEGTTAQGSGILRTHCSVPQNVELARRSWRAFERFAECLGDDEASSGTTCCRSDGGQQMLVSEGTAGELVDSADTGQGAVSDDDLLQIAGQAAERFPSLAEAGGASSWTGVYDVTPDWNPVLGRLSDERFRSGRLLVGRYGRGAVS